MAAATRDDVIAAALPADRAAIEDLDETILGQFIDAAALVVTSAWGALQSNAHALLVLHYLAPFIDGGTTSSGVVTSEANGPASRSFAAPKLDALPSEGEFVSTYYGRRFNLLRRIARGSILGISSNPVCA